MRHLTFIAALLASGCIDDNAPTQESEPDGGPCLPMAAACPPGFVQAAECPPDGELQCREVRDCGGRYLCLEVGQPECLAQPSCDDGWTEQDCDAAQPWCSIIEACGQRITCVDECQQPGLTPPCPDPLRYRGAPCGEDEPAECQDAQWCGAVYACVGEAEAPPVRVVECGEGWTNSGPGRCLPGDHARCFELQVDGETYACLDARCAAELAIDEGRCPNVLGARECYPNEPDCGDLPWCRVLFEGCAIDEIDCDAFPVCPPDTYDLRLERCLDEDLDGDGICDSFSVCSAGDPTCATHVTCGAAVACFDAACREFEPTCPLDTRPASEAERQMCLADGADNAIPDCQIDVQCDQQIVCVPGQG